MANFLNTYQDWLSEMGKPSGSGPSLSDQTDQLAEATQAPMQKPALRGNVFGGGGGKASGGSSTPFKTSQAPVDVGQPQKPAGGQPAAPQAPALPPGQTSQAPTTPAQPAGVAGVNVEPWVGGTPFGGETGRYTELFKPFQETYEKSAQGLRDLVSKFNTEAGGDISFTDSMRAALEQALSTGNEADFAEARKLLGGAWGGPQGLGSQQQLQDALASLNRLNATSDMPGLVDLLMQRNPTLTLGQARAEAQRLNKDQAFGAERAKFTGALRGLVGGAGSAAEQAKSVAATRAEQSKAAAEQAKGFLQGRAGEVSSAWQKRIDEDKALQDRIDALWTKAKSGDGQALAEIEQLTNPEAAKGYQDWRSKRDEVMAKYAGLEDIPEMALMEGKKGADLGFNEDWFAANKNRYSPKEWKTIKEQARARQAELDALGKAPTSAAAIGEDYAKRAGADQAWNAIMNANEYQAIKDKPVLELTINSAGRPTYAVKNEKGKLVRLGAAKWLSDAEKEMLIARQHALEAQFGDQVDPRKDKKGYKAKVGVSNAEGEYRDVKPLYYSGAVQDLPMEDFQQFAAYTRGEGPTQGQVATDEELARYNRAQELLGTGEQVAQSGLDWTPGQFSLDSAAWSQKDAANDMQREIALDQARKDWIRASRQARSAHRDENNPMNQVGSVVGDILPYAPATIALLAAAPWLAGTIGPMQAVGTDMAAGKIGNRALGV